MKRLSRLFAAACLVLAGALPASALMHPDRDPSQAAFSSSPDSLAVAAAYTRVARPLDLSGDLSLQADAIDAMIGWRPAVWCLLYVHGGAVQGKIPETPMGNTKFGPAAGLGFDLNLWQIDDGDESAWRFMIRLEGRWTWRSTAEDDTWGKLSWTEAHAALPFVYSLHFSRRAKVGYRDEFHAIEIFAGPAVSKLDGTWKRDSGDTDFDEDKLFGILGGAELRLFPNLGFGGRAEYFGKTGFSAYVRYDF
jgi:hypothetical protein